LGKNANSFRGSNFAEPKREIAVVFELMWLLVKAIVESWEARAAENLADIRGCGEATELTAMFEVANLADLRGRGEVTGLAAIFEVEVGRKLLGRNCLKSCVL
jgi:hypothetical protein